MDIKVTYLFNENRLEVKAGKGEKKIKIISDLFLRAL